MLSTQLLHDFNPACSVSEAMSHLPGLSVRLIIAVDAALHLLAGHGYAGAGVEVLRAWLP